MDLWDYLPFNRHLVHTFWHQKVAIFLLESDMGGSRNFRQRGRGGGVNNFFSHQHISQRAVQTSLRKQLDPSPIASGGWSVPEFLRKPTATCDFPGGSRLIEAGLLGTISSDGVSSSSGCQATYFRRNYSISTIDSSGTAVILLIKESMTVWANLAVTKLFGLRQDWPYLKNIHYFPSSISDWPLWAKIIWFWSLELVVSCCKHVDLTVAILVQRSMWSRVSLLILAGNLSRDHTAAKQMSAIL